MKSLQSFCHKCHSDNNIKAIELPVSDSMIFNLCEECRKGESMQTALNLITKDKNINPKFREGLKEQGICDHCGEKVELINGACEECWQLSDPEDFVPVRYYS